jgi:cell pole-organizing protein PopZ
MHARKNHSDMSIEDILESIRNVINDKSQTNEICDDLDQDELHLTNIKEDFEEEHDLDGEEIESMLSQEASERTKSILEDFAQTAFSLGHNINNINAPASNNKTIESFLENMLRPQMKEWLDANLPIIVKQVVSEEIKRLVANMNRT